MTPSDANKIGEAGELFLSLLLSQQTDQGFLFDPLLIGGKWPTVDVYAELTQHKGIFCFFQVKTTARGYDRANRLRIKISRRDLERLSAYHAPTYLIGVDLNLKDPYHSRAFLSTVRGLYDQNRLNLSMHHELTAPALLTLHQEVVDFWRQTNLATAKAVYKSAFDS